VDMGIGGPIELFFFKLKPL